MYLFVFVKKILLTSFCLSQKCGMLAFKNEYYSIFVGMQKKKVYKVLFEKIKKCF